ncbi:MAG TPA: 30S ribosomal protein S12 methylthiotransferase RimO [Desulfobacteraceae bacterium]|nr:30S ribosomal protein S12 methylthiotransferase RimO [Desulfobacteraceae bacterium]
MKFHIVTLGCDKNLVDSEEIAGRLEKAGMHLTSQWDEAGLLLINTCAFIDAAKEESIETILEYVQLRKERGLNMLIAVIGCLPEIHKKELAQEIPEVDEWITPSGYDEIEKLAVQGTVISPGAGKGFIGPFTQRVPLDKAHFRYLKISDGCDLPCSYCTIPRIRGPLKSRTLEDIKEELDRLSQDKRIKELILVSQSTSFYGRDNGSSLQKLLALLGRYDFFWKRLLYLDIRGIDEDFLKAVADNGILPYFDIPLQHANDEVLSAMKRGYTRKEILSKLDMIKKMFSEAVLRTTFIVGFPAESEARFRDLVTFVEKGYFDKMGAFAYSYQELSPGASLGDTVAGHVKEERVEEIMTLQREVSAQKMAALVGKEFDCLVDYTGEEGRIWCDAPDVDGVVFFNDNRAVEGELVPVRITGSYEYDLEGEIKL